MFYGVCWCWFCCFNMLCKRLYEMLEIVIKCYNIVCFRVVGCSAVEEIVLVVGRAVSIVIAWVQANTAKGSSAYARECFALPGHWAKNRSEHSKPSSETISNQIVQKYCSREEGMFPANAPERHQFVLLRKVTKFIYFCCERSPQKFLLTTTHA